MHAEGERTKDGGMEEKVAAEWGESGGVWNRSSRWTGVQRSEAQECSLCSGCCLSAGGSVVCLHISHVPSVRWPVCTAFLFSAACCRSSFRSDFALFLNQ